MVYIGDKIVSFIVEGSVTNTTLEQAGLVNEPIVGEKMVQFPTVGGGEIGVRPYHTYVGDDGLIIDTQETPLFFPGKPPSYLEPEEKWKDEGIPFEVSQGAAINRGWSTGPDGTVTFNGWWCPGNTNEWNLYIVLRRATEGITIECNTSAIRCVVMQQDGTVLLDAYRGGTVRLPIKPDDQTAFGKAGDTLWLWFRLSIGESISYNYSRPPTPATIHGLIKAWTVGRY